MNLMFWKKKAGAGEEAEDARENLAVNAKPRESLDFVAAKQDAAERNPEPSEPDSSGTDETGMETPAKSGLIARLKLRFGALAGHFRKAPAFRAEEDQAPVTPDSPEKPDNAAAMKSGMAPPDMEAPAVPGPAMRIKLRLIALVQRFRKTPAPDADEGHADETGKSPEPETPAKPGLLMRIKAGFAAFVREIKAPTAPAASEDQEDTDHGRSETAPEGEHPEGEPAAEPVRSRKWLVIGGSVVIVVLLLASIGIANWPIFEPPQKRWGTRHDMTSISSRPGDVASTPEGSQTSAPGKSQAEVEALKKENAELQARIEALKREPPLRQAYAPPTPQTAGSAPSSSVGGEMVVGNNDPRATAMSLKEAIEAMNAGSGDYGKKPAK